MPFSYGLWRTPWGDRNRTDWLKRRNETLKQIQPFALRDVTRNVQGLAETRRQRLPLGLAMPTAGAGQRRMVEEFAPPPAFGPISPTQPFQPEEERLDIGAQRARAFAQQVTPENARALGVVGRALRETETTPEELEQARQWSYSMHGPDVPSGVSRGLEGWERLANLTGSTMEDVLYPGRARLRERERGGATRWSGGMVADRPAREVAAELEQ